MTVLTPGGNAAPPPPELADPAGDEVEALFPEAEYRQRWRHKRLIVVTTMGVIVAVVVGLVVSNGHTKPAATSSSAGHKVATNVATPTNPAGTITAEVTNRVTALPYGSSTTTVHDETYSGNPAIVMFRETYWNGSGRGAGYVGILQRNETVYVRMQPSPTTPIALKGWYSFPDPRITNAAPLPKGRPFQVVGMTGLVARIGTSTMSGTPVTEYRVTVSVRAAAAEEAFALSRGSYESLLADGVADIPTEVWVDRSGQVEKEQQQLTLTKTKPAERELITSVFTYSSKPYPVVALPAGDVTSAPNESQAFGDAVFNPVPGT